VAAADTCCVAIAASFEDRGGVFADILAALAFESAKGGDRQAILRP
jgi:uncharacterized Ntn-hydrolase superfamily protein